MLITARRIELNPLDLKQAFPMLSLLEYYKPAIKNVKLYFVNVLEIYKVV